MKYKICSLLFLSFFIIQCQNKKEEASKNLKTHQKITDTMLDKNNLKTLLQKQQNAEFGEQEGNYVLSQTDLDVLSDVIAEKLSTQGYKRPTNEKFLELITSIFNIKNDCLEFSKLGDRYIVYHGILMDGTEKTLRKNLFESYVDTENLFYDKRNEIILNFTLLKNIAKFDRQNLVIELPPFIIARNKYLFNDSKADLVWLKANDKIFLESLVKIFGYVKDKELLEFVLKNNFKDKEALNSILWNQKCDGTAQVNKEVFDLVQTWSTQDLSVFSHNVLEVMLNLLKEIPEEKSANFSQKTRVLGLLAYYATKTDPNKYYSFFPILNDPDFDAEFKKASYYNISDFKEIYEETRYGGIGQAE